MSDPSYPIGKFTPPTAYTAESRREAVALVKATPARLRAAVAGLTADQLMTPYRDGGWTVAQVVHHVADAHVNAFVRFKWVLTEENPTIKLYDQVAWAGLPDATTTDVDPSLRLVEAIHARWGMLLDALTPADYERTFIHPKNGPQTVDRNLALYAWHGRHHVAHITSLRERKHW